MNTWDAIGYAASALVLTTFGMRSIIPLRVVAMCSNLVFIIYGLGLDLIPIWSLHAALLPMNAWRLVEALGAQKRVGLQVLHRAAHDDEPVIGGSTIRWLSTHAASNIECRLLPSIGSMETVVMNKPEPKPTKSVGPVDASNHSAGSRPVLLLTWSLDPTTRKLVGRWSVEGSNVSLAAAA